MTINEALTIEEHERTGLDLIGKLPDDNSFRYYYGTWAFTSHEGNSAEGHLMKAGTTAAWNGLGGLYERTAIFTENHGGSEFIHSGGSCKSRDLLAYWAIRAYLKAGNETKALETLSKFGDYQNAIYTLVNSAKEAGEHKEPKSESPDDRQFDLPDLIAFPKFRQELERIGKKYSADS